MEKERENKTMELLDLIEKVREFALNDSLDKAYDECRLFARTCPKNDNKSLIYENDQYLHSHEGSIGLETFLEQVNPSTINHKTKHFGLSSSNFNKKAPGLFKVYEEERVLILQAFPPEGMLKEYENLIKGTKEGKYFIEKEVINLAKNTIPRVSYAGGSDIGSALIKRKDNNSKTMPINGECEKYKNNARNYQHFYQELEEIPFVYNEAIIKPRFLAKYIVLDGKEKTIFADMMDQRAFLEGKDGFMNKEHLLFLDKKIQSYEKKYLDYKDNKNKNILNLLNQSKSNNINPELQ